MTPDPGVIEVNIQPAASWRAGGRDDDSASTRTRGRSRLGADKFMIDGRHTGTGGGNHVVARRRDAAGFAVPAPARSAQEPRPLLAAPSLAVLSVFGPVHRPDQPGAARRRSAPRPALRTRNRARATRRARRSVDPALAGRPALSQPARRRDRQHASRGNLHRQALFAGRADRPARPRRIPRLRNAARRAHEPRAAIAAARARSPGSGASRNRAVWCAGARRCTIAS